MKKRIAAAAAAIVCCLGLNACGSAAQTYTDYVQAVMECTYQGNADAYRKLTKASESEANGIYEEEIRYLSEQLCHQATVDRTALDAETAAGFDTLARTLLGKVKYSTSNAVKAGEYYQITITAEPLTVFDVTIADLETSYKDKFAKAFYEETPGTDSYAALEGAWGSCVLDIYNDHLDEVGNGDAQTLTTVLYVNQDGHYTVAEQDWKRIDDLLFGLAE